MSSERLEGRIKSRVKKLSNGRLHEYSLKFHKRSRKDQSGKCDAFYTGNQDDCVIGVIFQINKKGEKKLNKIEGLGYGYNKKIVEVFDDCGERVNSIIYYATDIVDYLKPYNWYKYHVLHGAVENGLPYDYISKIEQVDPIIDPDEERAENELSIYHRELTRRSDPTSKETKDRDLIEISRQK